MTDEKRVKCLIVGAGPVGALAALYAAKRGWDVEVYELRGGVLFIPFYSHFSDRMQTSEMHRLRHSTSPGPSIWPFQNEASMPSVTPAQTVCWMP